MFSWLAGLFKSKERRELDRLISRLPADRQRAHRRWAAGLGSGETESTDRVVQAADTIMIWGNLAEAQGYKVR